MGRTRVIGEYDSLPSDECEHSDISDEFDPIELSKRHLTAAERKDKAAAKEQKAQKTKEAKSKEDVTEEERSGMRPLPAGLIRKKPVFRPEEEEEPKGYEGETEVDAPKYEISGDIPLPNAGSIQPEFGIPPSEQKQSAREKAAEESKRSSKSNSNQEEAEVEQGSAAGSSEVPAEFSPRTLEKKRRFELLAAAGNMEPNERPKPYAVGHSLPLHFSSGHPIFHSGPCSRKNKIGLAYESSPKRLDMNLMVFLTLAGVAALINLIVCQKIHFTVKYVVISKAHRPGQRIRKTEDDK